MDHGKSCRRRLDLPLMTWVRQWASLRAKVTLGRMSPELFGIQESKLALLLYH